MFGFLNVYKPCGKTSHDVVAILRRVTKIKQIGHTGTLDPFAEGVLPICIGKATRLIEYLDDDKAYIGTVRFGSSTTTYDVEGDVVNISEKKITRENLEEALSFFRGDIQQLPPIYSAIKVNGKKLYEYARKGEEVEIKPRAITIYKLDIVAFDEKTQTAEILIECSKGTYIRSIANDLGERLGCFGHLVKLVRVKAGKFELDKSTMLENLADEDSVKEKLINPVDYLSYSVYELNEKEYEDVSHGKNIDINMQDSIVILTQQNRLIAVAQINNNKAKMLKVFI